MFEEQWIIMNSWHHQPDLCNCVYVCNIVQQQSQVWPSFHLLLTHGLVVIRLRHKLQVEVKMVSFNGSVATGFEASVGSLTLKQLNMIQEASK